MAVQNPSSNTRDFVYRASDFKRVREMIYAHAGISLGDSKSDMVYSRLARRLRALDIDSFSDYLDALNDDPTAEEWENFVNALTTNLTAFYREAHHFEILAEQMQKHRGRRSGERFVIWCSAASTGEEPYSIAMTAQEAFGSANPPVSILATDIDTQVLDAAAEGVYALDRVKTLSNARLRKFFQKGAGSKAGYARVTESLRQMVTFRQLNLLDRQWPLRGGFDAIFCRNVMIYFDKPTQYAILERMRTVIKPDGMLYCGHSESFQHAVNLFKPCGRSVYLPIAAAAQASPAAEPGGAMRRQHDAESAGSHA